MYGKKYIAREKCITNANAILRHDKSENNLLIPTRHARTKRPLFAPFNLYNKFRQTFYPLLQNLFHSPHYFCRIGINRIAFTRP